MRASTDQIRLENNFTDCRSHGGKNIPMGAEDHCLQTLFITMTLASQVGISIYLRRRDQGFKVCFVAMTHTV